MSNSISSIKASALFESLCNKAPANYDYGSILLVDPENLQGSASNPFKCLASLTVDTRDCFGYGADSFAQAVGAPVEWFEDDCLMAPAGEVLPALGRMALIFLSSLRNVALANVFDVEAREDSLNAESTFMALQAMNALTEAAA